MRSELEKSQAIKLKALLQKEFGAQDGQELVLLANLFSHLVLSTEVVQLQKIFDPARQKNRLSLRRVRSTLRTLERFGFIKAE